MNWRVSNVSIISFDILALLQKNKKWFVNLHIWPFTTGKQGIILVCVTLQIVKVTSCTDTRLIILMAAEVSTMLKNLESHYQQKGKVFSKWCTAIYTLKLLKCIHYIIHKLLHTWSYLENNEIGAYFVAVTPWSYWINQWSWSLCHY